MSSDDESEGSVLEEKHKVRRVPLMEPIPKIKIKTSQIVINLGMTRYDVIEDVAEDLEWKIQHSRKKNDWDVLWTDHMIQPQTLIKMHFHQKITHFPGIHVLARKNLLGLSFMEMSKKFPEQYNFFPKTWMLPNQYPELRQQMEKKQKCFIVKPEANCQGKGIFLTFKSDDVENGKHYVVQEYLSEPFLIQELKFDFRVYVLLAGTNPMRLYVYEEGLARFATEKYSPPSRFNIKNQFIHLTNYAVNKKSSNYIYNTSAKNMFTGHKRSLSAVYQHIQEKGFNLHSLKEKIYDVIVKTIILGQPLVSHQYRFAQPDDEYRQMCFHILGIDIMIDEFLNPIVLEVNHTPSFATDTPLDYTIKFNLIKDTLNLMNINEETKKQLVKKTNSYQRQRITNVKRLIQTQEQKEKVKEAQLERDRYESGNLGNYKKVYPVQDEKKMKEYQQFLKAADKLYFAQNNCIRMQIEQSENKNYQKNMDKQITNLNCTKAIIRKKPKTDFLSPVIPSPQQIEQRIKNETLELNNKQKRMSALLRQFDEFPSYLSYFPKGNPKINAAIQYNKSKKLVEEAKIRKSQYRQAFQKNLPKIQMKASMKSSTIEINRGKYITLSKKKSMSEKKRNFIDYINEKKGKQKQQNKILENGSFVSQFFKM